MNGDGEWKGALRLQIEALAKRNDLHRRCQRESVKHRTHEMDNRIVRLRELMSSDANQAAQFYLECVCHADETERILNRTSSRDKKRKKPKQSSLASTTPTLNSIPSTSAIELILPESLPYQDRVPPDKRWWDQLNIHRREDEYVEGKNATRELWKSQKDFFFSTFGFILGVGSLIRFPGLLYHYGGGVFLIPYIFCHILVGFPLLYLQLVIGQFSGCGVTEALPKLMPIARGLGWMLVTIAVPLIVYYNVYTSWTVFYLFVTLKSMISSTELPWESCNKAWNLTDSCCDVRTNCQNASLLSQEAYFHYSLLSLPAPPSHPVPFVGGLLPYLVFSLLSAWIFTLIGQIRSSRSTSNITVVTTTFPFLALSILFFRAISLPGADRGIRFMFTFDIDRLGNSEVWQVAMEQVFYELGLNSAPLISLAALNRFRNNAYRDAILVVILSLASSVFSALVAFSFLGVIATHTGSAVETLIALEPRYLVFTVYSSLSYIVPGGAFCTLVFFVCLLWAALNTQYAWISMLNSSIMSALSTKNTTFENKLSVAICVTGFLLGLPFCAKGGIYLFHSIDRLTVNWTSLLVAFLLVLMTCFMYGISSLLSDVSSMFRVTPSPLRRWRHLSSRQRLLALLGPAGAFVKYSWSLVCPIVLVVFIGLSIVNYDPITFSGQPIGWQMELIAWVIMTSPLIIIPISVIRSIAAARRNGKTINSLFDTSNWSQLELTEYGNGKNGPDEPPTATKTEAQRGAMRENTYMYIDPLSRGNTMHEAAMFNLEENYGWRIGRLKEMQDDPSLPQTSSQPSFAASMTSQGELTLFGSPPASNAFMLTEMRAARPMRKKQIASRSTDDEIPMNIIHQAKSEPPMKIASLSTANLAPSPPPPRSSPARSEPPFCMDRPGSSQRSKSESHDDLSDSDDEFGIRPQRITIIRRFYSTDSVGLQSSGSISITPIDMVRQRSLSSVALYDDKEHNNGATQSLSQLKRPAPIHAPKSPTRF